MALENVFAIAGSALAAQSMRLNVVSSNMANADSAASSTGPAYRAKQVVFTAMPLDKGGQVATGVKVTSVIEDPSPMRVMYDPKHPAADAKGYVTMPNVNPVDEMVNMISASRAYQANADVMNTAKNLLMKTLSLGQ